MSTSVLLASLALASTALSQAWSFELNLDGVKNDRFVVLHRQGCLLWYLLGVVLLGLVFTVVVASSSPRILVPLAVTWTMILGAVLALIVLVYKVSLQPSGVYEGNQETVATVLTHTIIILATLIDIYALFFIARREVVRRGGGGK